MCISERKFFAASVERLYIIGFNFRRVRFHKSAVDGYRKVFICKTESFANLMFYTTSHYTESQSKYLSQSNTARWKFIHTICTALSRRRFPFQINVLPARSCNICLSSLHPHTPPPLIHPVIIHEKPKPKTIYLPRTPVSSPTHKTAKRKRNARSKSQFPLIRQLSRNATQSNANDSRLPESTKFKKGRVEGNAKREDPRRPRINGNSCLKQGRNH